MEDKRDFLEEERAKEAREEENKKDSESYFRFEKGSEDKIPVAEPIEPAPPRSEGLAITALVLSLCSFLCCGFLAIPGLICAIIDRKKRGYFNGCAMAGLILSIIEIAFTVLITAAYVIIMVLGILAETGDPSFGTDPTILIRMISGNM